MREKARADQTQEIEVVLSASPFSNTHFNEPIKKQIHEKIKQKINPKKNAFYSRAIMAAVAFLMIAYFITFIKPDIYQSFKGEGDWQIRQTYKKAGETLFEVFPDPSLEAGKPTGYMISFTAPFEQFSGKSLEIDAIHRDSGLKIIAEPAHIITEPSSGYPGLGRYVTSFGLPISGVWRYEVKLNGVFYGDAVLNVNEPSWAISPLFKTGVYQVRGIEKNIAFIDTGFIAGKGNKYMWHFWGDKKKLDGPFTIKAVKKGNNEMINVFSASSLGGALNGADRIAVSSMSLPTSGIWRLLAYVNDQMLGSIVVDVK
jgi:hypothetical protein